MSSFSHVGILEVCSTGRSVRLKLHDNPYYFYISIKDIEDVLRGHKNTASVLKLRRTE